jgi:hypothetical protein
MEEKKFDSLPKKFGSAYALLLSHRENVRTSKYWRKSKEKKRNFFRKLTMGMYKVLF